jgi:hypothetical protein
MKQKTGDSPMRHIFNYTRFILSAVALLAMVARPVIVSIHNTNRSVPAQCSKTHLYDGCSMKAMITFWCLLNKMKAERPTAVAAVPRAQTRFPLLSWGSQPIPLSRNSIAGPSYFLVLRI